MCLRDALTGRNGLVHLLRYEDRNSMIHSIESRVPFLTTDIAEFLLSLPENFLLSDNGSTKCIFRDSMKGIVPHEVLQRKDKVGFETPESTWFSSEKSRINSWIDDFKESRFWIQIRQTFILTKCAVRKTIKVLSFGEF